MSVVDSLEKPLVELTGDPRLIVELVSGQAVAEAAARAGYSEATARRRLRDSGFREQLDEARRERDVALASILAGGAELGAVKLIEVVSDPATPPSVVVRAALALIELNVEVGSGRELASRLGSLEELVSQLVEARP